MLSLSVKKLKSVQERSCLVYFLRLLAVCWPGAQRHFLAHPVELDRRLLVILDVQGC